MYVQVLPILGCGDAIRTCFSKFCTFSGRARRSEYWYYLLFTQIVSFVPSMFLFISFISYLSAYITKKVNEEYYDKRNNNHQHYNYNYNNNYKTDFSYKNDYDEKVYFNPLFFMGIFIFVIVEIILAIPLISASVRRLHDTGKSGAYLLLNFIPFGSLILLFFFIEDSQQAINEYGPSPKYIIAQNNAPLVSNAQIIPVNGLQYPPSNMPFIQGYPQVYPVYPMYPLNYQIQQRPPQQDQVQRPPQVPIQQNIYTELQEVNAPSNNNNQKPMATPMASS